MDICNFCKRERDEVELLIASEDKIHICNDCADAAHDIVSSEVRKEKPKKRTEESIIKKENPINKTARIVAYNREIVLDIFDKVYNIHSRRNRSSEDGESSINIPSEVRLSPETFCLLVKLLNEAVKEFEIDYEATINELVKERKLYMSFDDLTQDK